jgi:hypothetical protein
MLLLAALGHHSGWTQRNKFNVDGWHPPTQQEEVVAVLWFDDGQSQRPC